MKSSSRRTFLQTAILSASSLALGQGIKVHQAAAQPRGKSSGRPYNSKFVEVGMQAGLSSPVIYGGTETKKFILETIGCGCAFLDYDNDGWLDMFILSGTTLSDAPAAATNRLYHNNRDGTFTDVTERAGLFSQGWACGVCVGDYNNDGYEDIFVTRWGHNSLYRNNGNGTFTDVTKEAGLAAAPRWSTGCTFVDTNRSGHLDLFISSYADFDLGKAPVPGQTPLCRFSGVPVNCGPRGFGQSGSLLYRNLGNGTFEDVSVKSRVSASRSSYGLSVLAGDFDNDGWQDIFVACDSSPSLLFMNNHDGTFREEAVTRGVAFSDDGEEQAGMGAAAADLSGKGHLDIVKTNFADDLPNFYRNDGSGNFEDVCHESGLAVDNRFVSWGIGIADFDNDGFPDIFIATGHVYPEVERRFPRYPFRTPHLVYRNLGSSQFEELLENQKLTEESFHSSRGCAFGDFDNDGDMDVLVINLGQAPSLLRNDTSGPARNWLKVKLTGTTSNRSAIGARVVLNAGERIQTQERQSQSSFLSCNDPRIHFGLGAVTEGELRIRWPDGKWDAPRKVQCNQTVHIVQGEKATKAL